MNKIIPFNKDITFDDKIGEIESIALDDNLAFMDNYSIKGELTVRGSRKLNNTEKDFAYPIPVEITVDDKYDTTKANINIDDFYYEIINENILKVKIDLILEDLYYKKNIGEKEIREIKPILEAEEILDVPLQEEDNDDEKEYSIYRVYLVSDSDTLDSILNKYKITKEDLACYNDLSSIKPGFKLIIPSQDE